MNVYDAAHNLARAIKNSDEYKEYLRKQEKVFANEKTKEMVIDFRKKTMEIQMEQMTGKEVSKERLEQLKRLEEIIMNNPVIHEFFMAEMRFGQMMSDIYKILGESINIDLGIENSKR
ncbi:YlbF family regulator [Caloranaerobacter ferrireducens]|uniref:YlbF family regulator n=1 Tax=Caloranaerobacter ferrireducens TaxID=1323370 RepID=UPI00084D4D68|nr:YlbF family regulator [Caloranaerobacter ferrireducens]